jgi:hypothetical protein
MAARSPNSLPLQVKNLFWDLEARSLRLERDQGMIIGRVLASGPWENPPRRRCRCREGISCSLRNT